MSKKNLNIQFIPRTRRDIDYHLKELKQAFVGSPQAKAEWLEMVERIKTGESGLYLIKARGVRLRFVGRVIDGSYHINAMAGKGMQEAAPLIIERCKAMGYASITYNTYRKGMGRVFASFGFELDERVSQVESSYILHLGGS
ncbi:hypothetical protein [Vibrio splendidus]|uniref:hypothetical protein n=1 Tax=Vibrio splendidus TaxID=29497 RepID=UPI0002E91AC2|nr:hypothetical protein [Vibrio splendidus]